MNQEELKIKEQDLRKKLCYTYSRSKKLFIRAEEVLTQMNFFAAPLIEHRDALDHLIRYISIKDEVGLNEKALDTLDKALGHEVRSYFDVADFICITIRDEISASLKRASKRKIQKVWDDYVVIKQRVVSVSEELAEIRSSRSGSIESVDKYEPVLDEMFEIYKDYHTKIEPQIRRTGIWK